MTGCDATQEWILPHWWRYYRAVASYPVTFVDFGMSQSAQLFCRKKGLLLQATDLLGYTKERSAIDPITAKFWDRIYPGDLWQARAIWFAKLLALLKTFYRDTLWIDLDCEIRKPLDALFALLSQKPGLAVAPTTTALQKSSRIVGLLLPEELGYNPGVLAFRHGSPSVLQWARLSFGAQ